ncbi:hypothetical protein [Parahaliea aestuarii]|uniref:Uncharacterized protein n=1 Tax=Parahaliea aestuarii TaxID=1852021 RepID=A0A5C8ZTC5_9GAMM|nr:hypothetical protein [Parahaliea aestuarii]TXS91685.1 hypothetical protein FVW59_11040 [Parahaliea aestuarii]
MKKPTWMLVSLWVLQGPAALAEDPELKACQRLKNSMDSYETKRRSGGSAAQMDRWKRARQEKKDEYDQRRCRQYRGQLK